MIKDIREPADIKNMHPAQLKALAEEIRAEIVRVTSECGGHLASNLGMVELTLALHYVLNCPQDKLVFDVGHQSYTHKLLTGRYESFQSLRKKGGASGFPRVSESAYDAFTAGHASTAISAALGMARTRDVMHGNQRVVAVVGDGALTGGMCYEALNDAGQSKTRMVVILNDNEMSISRNVGAMSSHLTDLRQSKGYRAFKRAVRAGLARIPKVGIPMFKFIEGLRDWLKSAFVDDKFFDALGFQYIGPVDGHDVKKLIRVLRRALDEEGPQLIHVVTRKGNGYLPAETHPDQFHGVAPFFIESGEARKSEAPSMGKIAAAEIAALADNDIRVCAVTASMAGGTGMDLFYRQHPERFFDVGIAEEHAVTMAAGMAATGMKPYIAIYSTFLQRAVDQISTDICINALPVTLLVDRAGLVGADGMTHQGMFDLTYLRMLPNMVVAAPRDVRDLKKLLRLSAEYDGPMTIRYPKSGEDMGPRIETQTAFKIGQWELLSDGADAMFLAVGRMVQIAMQAAIELAGKGVSAGVIDARFIKPMDEEMILRAAGAKLLVTLEENVLSGGFGEGVMEFLSRKGVRADVKALGLPDAYIEHATIAEQTADCALDAVSVARKVLESVGKNA